MNKKIILCLASCALCVTLLGCTATQSSVGKNIDMKMNDLSKTMSSIVALDAKDINFVKNIENAQPVSAYVGYHTPYYGNVNTYNLPTFGGFGYYPTNTYYGFNNGYAMNNGFYNGYGMPYNPYNSNPMFSNPNYNRIGNNNAGRFFSNIDTYRINSVNKDGKLVTTINTYHNGEPVESKTYEEEMPNDTIENSEQTNLNNSCTNCLISNSYGNQLRDNIIDNINYVKQLSQDIKNKEITLTKNQIQSVNELLDNIINTQNKINMTKSELNEQINNVQQNIETYETNPTNLNTKYIKLLSCMDTRNSYLQSILNSLLQMENCIDGNCQNGNCWNGNCANGNFFFPNGECSNCNNCPNCLTCNDCNTCDTCNGCENCTDCNNCYFCNNCENCTDCFNCENCRDCSNLANAKNCVGNCLNCQDNTTNNNLNNTNNNTNNQTNNSNEPTNTNAVTQVNISADDSIRDNLLDNTDSTNSQQESAEFLNVKPETLPEKYTEPEENTHIEENYDNSIFNENEHENNKALTA